MPARRAAARSLRVALVGDPAGWHLRRLHAALESAGHRAAVVRWGDLAAGIAAAAPAAAGETFLPESLARCDVVAVRAMPSGSLEEVIFRMDVLGRFAAAGTPVINSPRSLERAIDKYLSLAVLAAAGLPVPRTFVAQQPAEIERACAALGGDCVVKPIFGAEGRGLVRLAGTPALRAFLAAAPAGVAGSPPGPPPGAPVYLQEFVPHDGWDVRVLVIGDRTLAMRRRAPAGEWRTNISLGGRPEPFTAPPAWVDLAVRAAGAIGADVAGVDILPARDGRVLVLEVNGVPGWRGLESATGVDVAAAIASHLASRAAHAG